MRVPKISVLFISLIHYVIICRSIPPPPVSQQIEVRKCCRDTEYMNVTTCKKLGNESYPWGPIFADPTGRVQFHINYHMTVGVPDCGSREPWPVFQYEGSCDKLILLADGTLRHYLLENKADSKHLCADEVNDDTLFQEYNTSDYCIDKVMYEESGKQVIGLMAEMCIPTNKFPWQDTNFVIHRVVNPVCHGIAIICLLIVGLVYFVLPQLCDLVGNIITTLVVCLVFEQISDIIRIYDEYHSAMSYLVSDSVMYISSLGAFFWLNSLGFYVWKTIRSRNVFLRISDGKKYCYYSTYAWGSTFGMAAVALFAHLVLDTNSFRKEFKTVVEHAIAQLGVAVFLTTIIFTILVDLFFCLSTLQVINRMSSYGRIHHKLKYCFQLFVKLFIIITVNWFFFVLSWFPMNSFFYMHVAANLVQAIAILYVTVFNLKKIRFLLTKSCCHEKCVLPCCRPSDTGEIPEWGEEMMAMNRNPY